MTYPEAQHFWFGRINYEQRSPKASDLNLDRMRALLSLLGNPHQQLRIVHVAGSKGKGSTAAMVASVLRAAGYRTGLFTSPHLVEVEERIQVDGQPISGEELARLTTEVAAAVQVVDAMMPGGPGVTFFEVATALGFLHFRRRRVDVAVVEVGFGGRFDSTNVCQPLLAIITTISFDHTQQLGNTLGSIAREKAGIIKPGRPVVSGVRAVEGRQVIEAIAQQRGSPLCQLDVDFRYETEAGCVTADVEQWPRVQVRTKRGSWPVMNLPLFGDHQAANAAVVVAAVEILRGGGLPIADAAVTEGLARVHWPARLEVVGRRPLIVLDCAHNLASAQALIDTLQTSFPLAAPTARRLLLFAGSRDKDLGGMLHLLAPHFDHLYLTNFANNPRGVKPQKLAALLPPRASDSFTLSEDSVQALQQARAAAQPQDLLCVTGSVFLAGELRPHLLT